MRRAAVIGETFKKAWEHLEIGWRIARAVAVKAGVAVLDVGCVADLGGFTVRDDIDPRGGLFADQHCNVISHDFIKFLKVIVLASLSGEELVDDLLRTGQTAHVG